MARTNHVRERGTPAVDRATRLGAAIVAGEGSTTEGVPVRLSASQLEKLADLTALLGISRRLMLNVAARYALREVAASSRPPEQLRGWPRRFGKEVVSFEATLETKLVAKHVDGLEEFVVFGIKLLHRKLWKKAFA